MIILFEEGSLGRLTRAVRTVAVASPSDRTARPSTPRAASAASSPDWRPSLVPAWRPTTPTRRWPIIAHDGRGTPHWGSLLLDQDCTGGDFLPVDLTAIHVLDGILGSIRVGKVHIAKPARERLEPIDGEIHGANFTVRSEDLQDVILDDVSSESSYMDSSRSRCHRTFLSAAFRTRPRTTTAAIFAGSFWGQRRSASGLGLFIFLVIVPIDATTALRPFFGLGTDRFANLLRRSLFGRWTR